MKAELRNLKHAKFASEETPCFQAKLYIDGQRVAEVGNDGRGGSNYVHTDRAGREKIAALVQRFKDTRPVEEHEGIKLPWDEDFVITTLFIEEQCRKDMERSMKRKTLAIAGGKVWTLNTAYQPGLEFRARLQRALPPTAGPVDAILNELPQEQALARYIAGTA